MGIQLLAEVAGRFLGVIAAWIVFAFLMIAWLIAWFGIFGKSGRSPFWAILMFVPGVNVLLVLYHGLTPWPVEKELDELRGRLAEAQAEARRARDANPG